MPAISGGREIFVRLSRDKTGPKRHCRFALAEHKTEHSRRGSPTARPRDGSVTWNKKRKTLVARLAWTDSRIDVQFVARQRLFTLADHERALRILWRTGRYNEVACPSRKSHHYLGAD